MFMPLAMQHAQVRTRHCEPYECQSCHGRLAAAARTLNGGYNQKWTQLADGGLRATRSGRCLDVPEFATSPVEVEICTCSGGNNQGRKLPVQNIAPLSGGRCAVHRTRLHSIPTDGKSLCFAIPGPAH
ncbi:hypothetical protein ACFYNL_03605 [Streptomyces sp. NPDC007808]|uniref:hypothetical protein n=1 Tax=Streptomyces sp. NPDC007808 TaxID=3364779 RepID=UPI00368998C6